MDDDQSHFAVKYLIITRVTRFSIFADIVDDIELSTNSIYLYKYKINKYKIFILTYLFS